MMNKKWFYIGGMILVLLFIFIFSVPSDEDRSEVSDQSRTTAYHTENGFEQDGFNDRVKNENPSKKFQFIAKLLAVPPDEPKMIEYPKYQLGGSGTRGAIRDRNGNVIWRASKEAPVYSSSISPNDKKIVIGAGDGNAYVITNEGNKVIDLPQVPPGMDMLGLGNWVWIDNNRLLGESGVQNFDENGNPVGCCQGHNMSESRFYVYDLRTSRMEEMQLPENLRGKVLSIGKVLNTGELQLGHEGDGFSWYRVTDIGEEKR